MSRKFILIFIIVAALNILVSRSVLANKNKYGIHILETTEIDKASGLVNSTGGDWGYVTIVMRDDDLNLPKWQDFMDQCRRLHLIPIIRIATHSQGQAWVKPRPEDQDKWVEFLSSLNWPIKEKFIVLFNEPNHSKEWGGEINPQEYANYCNSLIQKFRESDSNFKLMLGGLDQAADGRNKTMREDDYLSLMVQAVPDIFNKLDAWATHSYPNHGFVGLPTNIGRASIKGYQWELNLIKTLGLTKDLKVFITETGWPEGGYYLNPQISSDYLAQAFKLWGEDEKVVAVTPFVLNYPEPPFNYFSYLDKEGSPSASYNKVLGLSKVKNEPEQIEKFEVLKTNLPDILPTNFEFKGKIKLKNTGQSIWGNPPSGQDASLDLFSRIPLLILRRAGEGQIIQPPRLVEEKLVEPGQEVELEFVFKTSSQSGELNLVLGDFTKTIYTYKPFELTNKKVNFGSQVINSLKLFLLKV